MDPRGFPESLPEFQRAFPDDAACAAYLEALRWPGGFSCPKCGVVEEPYRFPKRSSVVLRCRACRADISLTAGTSMHASRTPLSTWFWGAYLVTTQTPGQSALQFQRQLGLTRYETAFQMLHKLRAGMVRPDRDRIGGEHAVEVDETYVGGRARQADWTHNKVVVIGAVEARTRKDSEDMAATGRDTHKDGKPLKRRFYAGRLRLRAAINRREETLSDFVRDVVEPGTTVRTDGAPAYGELAANFDHDPMTMRKKSDNDRHLPLIHLVFSNLKTWLQGTHHGVSQDHLQAYLNEYAFRFNRRFYPMVSLNSLLGIAAHTVPPTYASLYSGEWKHAA